ncbi:MAG: ethylbenzene dehydrogenase-related protein, partial [Planctomycetota bacterium]
FPVQLIQWKAIWQKDVDEHFQDVQDLHPNYWADLYWFADGEFPYRVPDDFTRTEALDWFVAYRAGNPMADMFRRLAAQEMIAEGFGTSTTQAESVSVARGVWNDGEWTVVIARPMATTDDADYQFAPGRRDVIGFAVWEGSVENVGARKQHSQWTVFEIQP